MTASPPKVNGRVRPPAMPVLGDWQPLDATLSEPETTEPSKPQPEPAVETDKSDAIAQAEAEAIRARAWAESEERRIKAEAEAEAIRIKAVEDARKQKLVNDKAELRFAEEQAARKARIAKSKKEEQDTEREAAEQAEQAEAEKQAQELAAEEIAVADDKWRSYALNFYRVCAVVALPVQLNAFYDRDALWLMAAPLMLEGGAWVVQKGAASAVANGRPAWHYRLISWLLAFIAAGINLWHGLAAFDPATAIGTAFASIAGPGVWDLHEHGRIRRRDGVLTRRERKAAEKAAKHAAAEKAAEEARRREEKKAADEAAAEAARQLAEKRAKEFPKVWEHAERLAADLGETTVTESIWKRAKLDVDGALPGESAEVFRMRNAAEMRVEAARQKKPVSTLSKTTNAQRANQMPRTQRGPARKPPMRRRGDTAPYVAAARTQAAITAQQAAKNTSPNAN